MFVDIWYRIGLMIPGQADNGKQTLTSEDLVEEDLDVVNSEWLLGDNDTMKVTLH